MKEIKAIIRPFELDNVITALYQIEGLPGVTISDIKGFGKSKAKNSKDAFQEGLHLFVQRIKLELVVHNEMVDKVVDTIQRTAHTGNPGDGKIFIMEVNNTIKIRTNERGEKAI
ncbi:MAG: P-II family nitrogen regulator [Deltaproteobacteria bacterium]|nr:P-II family nitrogen regulator [Deltaproteobacteria bacterium]